MPERFARLKAVLFDFDGTLADTAGDLGAAVNRLRVARGFDPLPLVHYRPHASGGARALLRAGFGITPDDGEFPALRAAFLDEYQRDPCSLTRLFEGMQDVLAHIAARKFSWGIVTNKSGRFAGLIVEKLGLAPDCIVCGDTTPHMKPHPEPLLHAARTLKLDPRECLYVGDDLRDIQAARAASMPVIAAAWGYIGPDAPPPHAWEADAVLSKPSDLITLLETPSVAMRGTMST